MEKDPYHRRHIFLPHHIPEIYFKSDSLVVSGAYTCAVIWGIAIRLVRGLWYVAHEEVLGQLNILKLKYLQFWSQIKQKSAVILIMAMIAQSFVHHCTCTIK